MLLKLYIWRGIILWNLISHKTNKNFGKKINWFSNESPLYTNLEYQSHKANIHSIFYGFKYVSIVIFILTTYNKIFLFDNDFHI